MRRPGLLLAVAAVAVHAPRLVVAYLEAEGVPVPGGWRAMLLAASGLATPLVLTGGAAYLALTIPQVDRYRGVLLWGWVAVLVATTALLSPLLVGSLSSRELGAVLETPQIQWIWAVTAVGAVELVAALAMVADAARSAETSARQQTEQQLEQVARERNRLLVERDALLSSAAIAPSQPAAAGRATCPNECGWRSSPGTNPTKAVAGHLRACPAKGDETDAIG